jgi:DNA-binding transcriptional LysR family regulator
LRGELDAAICLHPPFVMPKTLSWEQLCEEPLVVMAPARWGQRDAHALLREEPFIRYNRILGGGKQADAYLRKAGIVPRERFELSSLPAIAMLVDRGLGVSLAPDASVPWWRGLRVARLAAGRISRIVAASGSSGHAHRCGRALILTLV